jgi:abnormal spindle-like microcephaly-associated protein
VVVWWHSKRVKIAGIKQKVLDMLLSYNPLWLRIGLETIYGEIIGLHSNTDIIGLSRFIVTRLLGNPDIAAEFAHPSVRYVYRPGEYLGFTVVFI